MRKALILLATLAALTACASTKAPAASSTSSTAAAAPFTADAQTVVTAITAAGLAAANPRDNAAKNCPTYGCKQMITTDNITVLTFPEEAKAKKYADGALGQAYRRGDVVLSYLAARTPADQQPAYQQVLDGLS